MIFTDKFVYVHEPKTGGTFVTTALFRIYGVGWNRLTHLRNALTGRISRTHPDYGTLTHNSNKHGGCGEIPSEQRGKKILATVRNPYDIYVSQYEFGWWRRSEFLKYFRAVPGFARDYPRFPGITFAEFVRLVNEAFCRTNGDGAGAGWRTEEFVKFYFKNPGDALSKIADDDYARSRRYEPEMHDLHFLRTDHLNQGLYDFLSQTGYAHRDINFILELGKILPRGKGRSATQKWEHYYTPQLKQTVRRKERFLFALFPEFDE